MRRIVILLACGLCLAVTALGQGQRARIERRALAKPADIQGYPCAPGYAWFYEDGALNSCQVTRAVDFGEAKITAGSWITLAPDGKPGMVFLRDDTRIGAAVCTGSAMGREGSTTVFYASGKLKECFLPEDREIQGVPCAHGGFFSELFGGPAQVQFYENGDLHSCRLSKAATVGGKQLAKGERVNLNPAH
jgi:hypothetical protein